MTLFSPTFFDSNDAPKLLGSFSAALEYPENLYQQWKQDGGMLAGYLSANIPLEILHAAGILPVHLNGEPGLSTEKAEKFMEAAFDPLTRSVFERLLRNHFNDLDILVLPRANDTHQRLYYYLCELLRAYPEYSLPEVELLDLLNTLRPASDRHNQRHLSQFIEKLAEKTGKNINGAALQNSIETYNHARHLMAEFTSLRARSPLSLNGELTFWVYQAARIMPIKLFNESLAALLIEARQLPEQAHKKIILAGNGLDYPGLYQLIDSRGATVVGDYHAYGNHFLSGEISRDKEPLVAISHYYQQDSRSCRSVNVDPKEIVDFAREQGASGVIFYFLLGEEAWTWQQPQQKKALAEAGIPSIVFYDQPYQLNEALLAELIQAFIESI